MRAAWYEKNGPAAEVLKLGDLPMAEPGPGEVRVRVVVSGLNPTDVKSRAGSRPMGFPRVVPHQDGAGVIDAVGPGVPASRVGERVWLYTVQWQRPWGTAAEYTVVPARQVVPVPTELSDEQAACFFVNPVTALVMTQKVLRIPRGGWLLIHAGQRGVESPSSPPSARKRRPSWPRKRGPITW